jgi:N-acetylmuramate 1-kinase
MSELLERIHQYLKVNAIDSAVEPLTPDASTRRYFRIQHGGRPMVACAYPDDIKHLARSYIDVSEVFGSNDLPVAEVFDYDEVLGVLVLEDLGDMILRVKMAECTESERDQLFRDAISLIARIQKATDSAVESNSIASRLRFDTEKLMWELNFFKIHYFTTFKKEPLDPMVDQAIEAEFNELSEALDQYASVLCHRDFHAANLMIDGKGQLRIIDHQDARIGSTSYDLVSLLLDRVTDTPSDIWIVGMLEYFHREREAMGLERLDRDAFRQEFQLQTVQRCLKAAGTFSFQSAVRDKAYFVPFIKPMFRIALQAAEDLGHFPHLQEMLIREINE